MLSEKPNDFIRMVLLNENFIYYGLNVCVLPDSYVEILMPMVMVRGGGPLGSV